MISPTMTPKPHATLPRPCPVCQGNDREKRTVLVLDGNHHTGRVYCSHCGGYRRKMTENECQC